MEYKECKGKTLQEFDNNLAQAMKIGTKYFKELGDECWYLIIEFLNNYLVDMNRHKAEAGDKTIDRQDMENVRSFILKRKDIVLKTLPLELSFRNLIERLNMDFRQIKSLYDYRLGLIKNDQKFFELASSIVSNELMDLGSNLLEE